MAIVLLQQSPAALKVSAITPAPRPFRVPQEQSQRFWHN